MPAVEVRDLRKRYGARSVVDGISFTVQRGEVFSLLGPNGAGKTTTIEILEGYRRPDGGTVRVLGRDPLRESAETKQRIGLMLQQGGIYPQIKALEALRLFASFYRQSEDPEALLDMLDLRAAASTRFRQLSGGQKQRLSLGLALIGKPELVFLDEPTAAMDPQARRATWEVIRSLRERNATVLLTTHFMDEAEQLSDRVAIMQQGRLVALDTPSGLQTHVAKELRFKTAPLVEVGDVASTLGVPVGDVEREVDGALVVRTDPTPALVGRLSAWLERQDVLLTELHAGSRSLEQAFLDITGGSPAD